MVRVKWFDWLPEQCLGQFETKKAKESTGVYSCSVIGLQETRKTTTTSRVSKWTQSSQQASGTCTSSMVSAFFFANKIILYFKRHTAARCWKCACSWRSWGGKPKSKGEISCAYIPAGQLWPTKMFAAAVFLLLRRFARSQELLCIMDAKKDINFCKDFALSSLRAY